MAEAVRLAEETPAEPVTPAVGVFATCDPRIDAPSRRRAVNIAAMTAKKVAAQVALPGGAPVRVVYSPILVDGERQADAVARQFLAEGVGVLICVPDTWAFPQLGLLSLLAHFPADTPVNLTTGNSGPKPGVVFAHAANGALAQAGRLSHLNVGNWPDTGEEPEMTDKTAEALVDWTFAALTRQALKGRRVVIFGHDSMGMETALAHILPTRKTFGLEITRLDMKLLADMLQKQAYDQAELAALRGWLEARVGSRIELNSDDDRKRLDQSLALYLIARDILKDLNAVGGGFMSQLEWGSDPRGIPLPVADIMESLFNSTFDHTGRKAPVPFATEADVQGLLTMLFFTYLAAGHPPLFMDFRKVWEPWEIEQLARSLNMGPVDPQSIWWQRGFVDGDNSGSAAFDWAALPGASVEEIMMAVGLPQADPGYFPGLGNSVTFISPGDITGIAGRLAYSAPTGLFSLVWDEAQTVSLPARLAQAVAATSTSTWPHTFVVPKYATMGEYKQYAPANHFHMTWDLKPARLEYWMDLVNVLSLTPWQERPAYIEGVDRPLPLLHVLSGGELAAKQARAR